MNILFIKKLQIMASIGINNWEKNYLQKIFIDIELSIRSCCSKNTVSLINHIDYIKIKDAIVFLVQKKHFNLIENLAEEIVDMLITNFSIISFIKITINKPSAILEASNVGITIIRHIKKQ
ncbi:dihydroneopterin aldolase/dihydroneopterin triphosphate 2'-epimerase [Wigglesworthia glossinidia endosymbiont of Glossina morsitans morsitans (Yale colony)]|uniref:7,8-dihydroneopterin aldolase n=1 Tax=Wigglesworthia glossinidia endosymbiont of Glossina morsitans morsitans (Yale colony) TaxID=1142511 RepID=H6Q5S8_WIGGL|nr:dihydroneopterin aldolase [Wigglesworthia glossinidia]AFA41124.1 dihydroneopterin aldolase/dihydroneopterin triphosphate 2'-epimerase [Wigglesworthia glossinidia endosymbiont of Glossina morsitans morsitans (Yale colony)]